MGIFNTLFGSKENEDDSSSKDYIQNIINKGEGAPIGVSKSNIVYAGYNELGGYFYLQTYIMGTFKLKTKTGAKLLITGEDYTLNLNSDMNELESENSPFFKGYITQIDFEIDKASINKIKKATIKELVLTTKKEAIVFTKYKDNSVT